MKNYFKIFGLIVLVVAIGFSVAACPDEDEPVNPVDPIDPDNTGGNGTLPSLEGSWHSSVYSETFTFNVAAGTFTKMSDQGWGEGGTFTYTATHFTTTVTQVFDGGSWSALAPKVETRPYVITNGVLILWGQNVYEKKDIESEPVGAANYRILSIGASFTRDAMTYLRDMLVQNGVNNEDILIVNAYIGGQTLQGHASNARNNTAAYTRQSFGTRGAMTTTHSVRLIDLVTSSEWDYISFQQGADRAGDPAYYRNEDIEFLLEYVKEHCPNPDVKIMFHMTWAYAANSTQSVFINTYNRDQMLMYNAIINTAQSIILPNEGFDFILPSGTAIQNARNVFGDFLNSDGYHLNDRGRFIAGAMWLRQIYSLSVDVFDAPYQAQNNVTLTLDDIAKIDKCVQDAFDYPFEVTFQ